MPLIEDAVNSVQTALEAGLDDVLKSRGLTTIKEYIFSEKDLDALDKTPVVYIFGNVTVIERWLTAPNGLWDGTHDLTVGIVLETTESEVLRRLLYKYTRAMIEVIIDSYPTDEFFPRGQIRIEYSPVLSRNSRFLGDAFIGLTLQKVEDRP